MIVNTKTGLKLNTTEQRLLTKAAALLRLIAKHGDDNNLNAADAAKNIEAVQEELMPVDETTLVGAK